VSAPSAFRSCFSLYYLSCSNLLRRSAWAWTFTEPNAANLVRHVSKASPGALPPLVMYTAPEKRKSIYIIIRKRHSTSASVRVNVTLPQGNRITKWSSHAPRGACKWALRPRVVEAVETDRATIIWFCYRNRNMKCWKCWVMFLVVLYR